MDDAQRISDEGPRTLTVRWQRLVGPEGTTCDRCAATQPEVVQAVSKLEAALRPLGIVPELEIGELDRATFEAAPSESNRIWISGRPLEEWVDARVGSSQCCGVCGASPCRTVEAGGRTHEVVPASLILKAGLIAAAQLLDDPND